MDAAAVSVALVHGLPASYWGWGRMPTRRFWAASPAVAAPVSVASRPGAEQIVRFGRVEHGG